MDDGVCLILGCREDIEAIKDCLDKYYDGGDDSYDIYALVIDIEKIVGS